MNMHGRGIKRVLPESSPTGLTESFRSAVADTNYKETLLLRVGMEIQC